MRVCFDGLCFANRRTAVIDEATQTAPAEHSTAFGRATVVNVPDTGGHTADQSYSLYAQSLIESKNTATDSLQLASKEPHDTHRKNHATSSSTIPQSKVSALHF